MVAEGDKVAWRATTRGTHRGDLMGIPPTGKPIEVSSIIVSRFDNGKWAEDWVLIDMLGMLQQLGVIPTPGQSA
jgi:predicted ester cyclase